MSGFIAVVSTRVEGGELASHAPDAPGATDATTASLVRDEAERLAGCYEELRGEGVRSAASAGTWAHAIKIDTPAAELDGVERTSTGWSIHAGAAYGPRPLASADLGELEGQFALLRRPDGHDELELIADPFGMQAVYVAFRSDLAFASTSALAIARHLRAPAGRESVLAFLRAGMYFGAPTHWPEIRRLEPATVMRLGPGVCDERRYWRPGLDPRVRRLQFDEAVENMIDTTVGAWAPLRDRPVSWADLTGGFDTRLMDLLLSETGVGFETQSRETRRHEDADIARVVAARAGWPWQLFPLPANWPEQYPSLVPTALGWSDGQLDALHLARNLWGHRAAGQSHRGLFVGIGGDHLRGHAWRQEMYLEGRSNRVNYDNLLDMRLLHPLDVSLFASDPTPAVRDRLRQQVQARAEPYRDELNTVQLDAIHAYKMTGHAGSFCSADGAFLRAQVPFYFRPVFTAAFSTDHRHRNNHRLMRHMIERLNPDVATVRTDTGGPAAAWRLTNVHRFVPYYAKLGRKATNKLSYRMTGRELLPVSLPMDGAFTAAIADYVRTLGLERRTMRTGALYSPAVDTFLADAADGRFADVDLLGRIVTLELALGAAGSALV